MPASQWTTTRQSKFIGENKIPATEELDPSQLLVAYNTVATADFCLESRKDKTAINATLGTGPVRGVWRYVKSDGTAYLVALHGTTLYAGTWAGGTASCTFASIATVANVKTRAVVWKDKLWFTNATDGLKSWDGTTVTAIAAAPKADIIALHVNRMFLVDSANPNQLRWSALEDATAWDALDVILVRDNDGDRITGLAPLKGGLLVFKRNSSWSLYGTYYDDMQLELLSDSIGCHATDSVTTLIDQGMMLSSDNLYRFSLSQIEEYPKTHKLLLDVMTATERAAVISQVVPNEKRVVVMLPSLCINAEASTGGMTTWTDINAASFSIADSAVDDGSLLIGDATNGIVYALNNETAGGFVTEFWFPFNDYGSTREKVWRVFYPELDILDGANTDGTATIYLRYDVDRGQRLGYMPFTGSSADVMLWSSGDDWNEQSWGPSGSAQRWPMHDARGRRISLQLSTNSRIKLQGYALQLREVGKLL